jgi:hypothetical protein
MPSSVPAVVRLRRLLKAIGRGYLFRCESIEEIAQDRAEPGTDQHGGGSSPPVAQDATGGAG